MRVYSAAVTGLALALIGFIVFHRQAETSPSWRPISPHAQWRYRVLIKDVVPDEHTAIEYAKVALRAGYGDKQVAQAGELIAKLDEADGVWLVTTKPWPVPSDRRLIIMGGEPHVAIRKKDAAIVGLFWTQ